MGSVPRLDAFNIRDVSRSDKTLLRFRHLETAFDYDAPRRRLALCYCGRADGVWRVERGADYRAWTDLHVVGELLFGPSPWRRSCVLAVFGRLGSVQAAVSALAEPSPDFAYTFGFEEVEERGKLRLRARRIRGLWQAAEAAYYEGVLNARG